MAGAGSTLPEALGRSEALGTGDQRGAQLPAGEDVCAAPLREVAGPRLLDVYLSPREQRELQALAVAINENKRHLPARTWHHDAFQARYLSLCAERAVARITGAEHQVAVYPGGDKGIDLVLPTGQTVQVKARSQRYRDLATDGIRFWEELQADVYILCWPTEDQQGITIVGYVTRERFLSWIISHRPQRLRGEKWVIPWQELDSVHDLLVQLRTDVSD